MAEPLVAEFASLNTDDRTVALRGIVDNLTDYDWRYLQSIFKPKSFKKDIVGSLPIEIVLLIFSKLDAATVFTCERVSKHWAAILTSNDICRDLTWRFDSHGGALPQTVVRRSHSSARHDYWPVYSRIRRFVQGRPCRGVSVRTRIQGTKSDNLCTFNKETLAWIHHDGNDTCVKVCNLRNGHHRVVRAEDRSRILSVALADQLVFFTTVSACCEALDLETGARRLIRLPSPAIYWTSTYGRSISIRVLSHIVTWNFDTGRCTSLDTTSAFHAAAWKAMLLHSDEANLTLFGGDDGSKRAIPSRWVGGPDPNRNIHLIIPRQFTTTGEAFDDRDSDDQEDRLYLVKGGSVEVKYGYPSDDAKNHVLVVETSYNHDLHVAPQMQHIAYYPKTLTLELLDDRPAINPCLFWKGVVYEQRSLWQHRLDGISTRPDTLSSNAQNNSGPVPSARYAHQGLISSEEHWNAVGLSAIRRKRLPPIPKMRFDTPQQGAYPGEASHLGSLGPSALLLGNDTFLVHFWDYCITVWCFDESIDLNLPGMETLGRWTYDDHGCPQLY